ncbi:hypothetical protein BFC18_00065 [Alteromonas confluentis]|uniref:Uncharacterized protein n=1 Tax=Alteromonas confluentis TaxID=1656094 RepID=A0A1E7ZGX5_9ALTE|nr:hypothetical protein BFC18_00065 [Alteromonas confluentis]
MNLKCCFKIKKWKCSGSVSFLDLFGLAILLSFYLVAISVVSLIIGSLFYSIFLSAFEAGKLRFFLEFGVEIAVFLWFLLKSLGKFLYACSFLINYKLTVEQTCSVCGDKSTLLDIPKNSDPF